MTLAHGVIIAITAIAISSHAADFSAPRYFPDLGISMPTLEHAKADPLPAPEAQAWLATSQDGSQQLIDRFDPLDLWTTMTVRARWRDADGNRLWISRLNRAVPPSNARTMSRKEFAEAFDVPMDPKRSALRDEAAALSVPTELGAPEEVFHVNGRNFSAIIRYASTNALVYAFRPKPRGKTEAGDWYLAAFIPADTTDMSEHDDLFREKFLEKVSMPSRKETPVVLTDSNITESVRLARLAAHQSVVNYNDWHATDGRGVIVLDNLDSLTDRIFVDTLTNDLPRLRAACAEIIPGGLPANDALALVKVYRDKTEYIADLGTNYEWTAAVWDAARRELVLYLPESGIEDLMSNVRHEAFHQFLAATGAMISAAPWINEGFAEVFSAAKINNDNVVFPEHPLHAPFIRANAEALVNMIPSILSMTYEEFYSGTDEERRAHYAVAWSIAYFLIKGAPEFREHPFASLTREYMSALLKTRNGAAATVACFRSPERLELLQSEWLEFWKQ